MGSREAAHSTPLPPAYFAPGASRYRPPPTTAYCAPRLRTPPSLRNANFSILDTLASTTKILLNGAPGSPSARTRWRGSARVGAFLLLRSSQKGFLAVVPYFLLFSTLVFALRGVITRWTRRHSEGTTQSRWAFVRACALQFVIGIYGGYFGGGIGILMLASYSVLGMTDIHVMNALKTVLASAINGVAVLIFALSGIVIWPVALLMVVAAVLGGYGGAAIARKLDPRWVQWFVVAVGALLTVYFFIY